MTTTVREVIAVMLTHERRAAIENEQIARAALVEALADGGSYPISDYMTRVLKFEGEAAPWRWATNASSGDDIITGATIAYQKHLDDLVKVGLAPFSSDPMTNLANQYKHEGARKFVNTVGPLLDRLA